MITKMVLLTVTLLSIWSKGVKGSDNILRATCQIKPGSGTSDTVKGIISLEEQFKDDKSSTLSVSVKLSGFNTTDGVTMHGFHVHVNGSTADKCSGAGSHYNVDKSLHGAPYDPKGKKHAGDFGNLNETSAGTIDNYITIDFASLVGDNSIANRSLVVHAMADDLGLGMAPTSNTTGNSGARLGCCVILMSSSTTWQSSIILLIFSSLIHILRSKCDY